MRFKHRAVIVFAAFVPAANGRARRPSRKSEHNALDFTFAIALSNTSPPKRLDYRSHLPHRGGRRGLLAMRVLVNNNRLATRRRVLPRLGPRRGPAGPDRAGARPVLAACRSLADLRFASGRAASEPRLRMAGACRSLLIPRRALAAARRFHCKACRSLLIQPPTANLRGRRAGRVAHSTHPRAVPEPLPIPRVAPAGTSK